MGLFSRESGPMRTVRLYCEASNANDLAAMTRLMDENFRVVDSTGEMVEGRDNVLEAMRRFVALAPDFHIEITDMFSRGEQVFMRGRASCSQEGLTGDVMWRAEADSRRILRWESFAPEQPARLTRILMPGLSVDAARRDS